MHPNPRRLIPVLILVILVIVAAWWYFIQSRSANSSNVLSASGTIEATEVRLSGELGGRILKINVNEGDYVKTGDVLLEFDSALLESQQAQAKASLESTKSNADAAQSNAVAAQAQWTAAKTSLTSAQAGVEAAQASLDLLKAGPTSEQVQAAESQLAQAQANYRALQASFAVLTAGARPEDIAASRLRLDQARQEYYGLQVVLTTQQMADVNKAMTQAQSNLSQANVRKTEIGKDGRTPASALEAASAAVTDAQAALDAATSAYQTLQEPPASQASASPFYEQIEQARKSWEIADLNLSQAKARQTSLQADTNMTQAALDAAQSAVVDAQSQADAAKTAYDSLSIGDAADRLKSAWTEVQNAQNQLNGLGRAAAGSTTTVENLLNQLDAAAAQQDAVSANLTNLKNGARSEQITAAQAQLNAAQAQVASAQAQIDAAKAKADAAQAQADAAQSQVGAAQASVDMLGVQIAKLTIIAPSDGVVLSRSVQAGEVASPSSTLLTLGRLSELDITVYVPEDRYGQIQLSQTAKVSVDSYPGITFTATVTHIADKAEFTPRNVQTAEGRRTTVFAVKLSIDNRDGKLKPGMPADVKFEP